MACADTLVLEGIAASIGSIGDAYDSALAESTIGLFKNEAIRDDSPFRTGPLRRLEHVEWVTMAWVDWYSQHRLHSRLGGDLWPTSLTAMVGRSLVWANSKRGNWPTSLTSYRVVGRH